MRQKFKVAPFHIAYAVVAGISAWIVSAFFFLHATIGLVGLFSGDAYTILRRVAFLFVLSPFGFAGYGLVRFVQLKLAR